jgi:hypothetical protein
MGHFIGKTLNYWYYIDFHRYRRGCDPMVVGFTSSNPVHGEEYSMQHNVIKFVSDLRQVGGFVRVLQFSPPIKLIPTI